MPIIKNIRLVSAGAFLLIASNTAIGETDSRKYSTDGTMFVEITSFNKAEKSKQEVAALMRCGTCPGIDGFLPATITKRIWMETKSGQYKLPESLVTDLNNLHVGKSFIKSSFRARSTKKGLIANISGGDGSGSYKVIFEIDLANTRVKRYLTQHPTPDKLELKEASLFFADKKK